MRPRTPQTALPLIARVLFGFWFAYSGGQKLFVTGLDRFTQDIANYRLVGPPLDAIAAYTVPWFELIAGAALMLGIYKKGAILLCSGLTAMFGVAVTWAWLQGLDISCGCYGSDDPMSYGWKFAELGFYLILLGWLYHSERTITDAPVGVQSSE